MLTLHLPGCGLFDCVLVVMTKSMESAKSPLHVDSAEWFGWISLSLFLKLWTSNSWKKAPHVFLSSFDVVGLLLVPVIYTGFFDTFGQVTVSTKSAKSDKQYVWEAEADTSVYTIREETDAKQLIPRGTTITLHLRVSYKAASYWTPSTVSLVVPGCFTLQICDFDLWSWPNSFPCMDQKSGNVECRNLFERSSLLTRFVVWWTMNG